MINYNRLGYEVKRNLSKFSSKISQGLKRPQQKFIHQMIYGILAGNKVHLSEIARSLKENRSFKKTIDRLSRNLNAFDEKQSLMHNYLSLVKQHVKEDYAVIVIDNSDIAKPASKKLEALSEIRDASTGAIMQGYLTIEAAVLSKSGKMPLPVYEKVFSAAENSFVSETYENLCCLESLSENFSPKCVRTLDRGFDANDYYRYFLKRSERFVIRASPNLENCQSPFKMSPVVFSLPPARGILLLAGGLAAFHNFGLEMSRLRSTAHGGPGLDVFKSM